MALISVVVPVFHNAESLASLVERLRKVAQASAGDLFEFVFVDDGSRDESFRILQRFAEEDEDIRVVKLSRNFGSDSAILAGLTYATGDCTAIISADLQDPPELIPALMSPWKEGHQVVIAVRSARGDPILSRLGSFAFNQLFHWLVARDFPASGFDFCLIDRCVTDVIISSREKNSHVFAQIIWTGFRRHTVSYTRARREHGRSQWRFARKVKYLVDAFASFSFLPLRLAEVFGILIGGAGLLYALAIAIRYLCGGAAAQGWASLMVVILVTSGVQLVFLGVLGEYLWRAMDASRARPPFVVESVLNPPKRGEVNGDM